MSLADLQPLMLGLILACAALLVLLVDLVIKPSGKPILGWLTAAILAGTLVASWLLPLEGEVQAGVWQGNLWSTFLARVMISAGLLAVLGGLDYVARVWPYRQGEFYTLLLFSLTGMVLLPGCRELAAFVVCFELMGIPIYVLAAYSKNDNGKKPPEAALKLLLIGAASTALTFFGAALLVGMAGSSRFAELVPYEPGPLHAVAALLLLAGMAFKIGVAPFHMWVPDTYEGSPTPVVAFLSVAPKVAGFAALSSIFLIAMPTLAHAWRPMLWLLVVVTMVVGNLVAIPQTNLKRLMAFSGVAQVGYILLGFLGGAEFGAAMMLFYLATYVFANIGMFLIVHAVAEAGEGEDIVSLNGLARRSPWLALALLMFLLSLAGIPFVAGFWAKFYVFTAAWRAGHGEMVLLGALFATVALFYYLGVARAAFVNKSAIEGPVPVKRPLALAIVVCLLGTVGLGAWPNPLVEAALAAVQGLY
jgi:NADH-quinone oxidoreductase subunit N